MLQRKALGRGLDSLIPKTPAAAVQDVAAEAEARTPSTPLSVPVDAISPNRHQPRQVFDEERIRDLAESIKERGIIQPLIVSESSGGRYELIAGERRLRAARMLGLVDVPVIIKNNVDEEGMLALALIENIQREDLGCIEESKALRELVEQFNYSQEEIAAKVGKSRSHVANSLRLLKLPQVVQDDLTAGRYSAGHARALLSLPNSHEQLKMREILLKSVPSVRDVERMVEERGKATGVSRKRKEVASLSPQIAQVVGEMVQALGTKVRLKTRAKGAGQVVIEYYSAQDLDRIYRRIVS